MTYVTTIEDTNILRERTFKLCQYLSSVVPAYLRSVESWSTASRTWPAAPVEGSAGVTGSVRNSFHMLIYFQEIIYEIFLLLCIFLPIKS